MVSGEDHSTRCFSVKVARHASTASRLSITLSSLLTTSFLKCSSPRRCWSRRSLKALRVPIETAKLFKHGGSQAVRLPKDFRLPGTQVRVRRLGRGVLLEPMERSIEEIKGIFAEI